MAKRNFRVLIDNDGSKYRFNSFEFKVNIRNYVSTRKEKGEKFTAELAKKELAEKLCVSSDAIKNWISGYNGPADIETVKSAAEYLQIPYEVLLEREEDVKMMNENKEVKNVTYSFDSTKDVIRNLYHEMAEFMDLVRETTCFEYMSQVEYEEYSSRFNFLVTLLHKSMLDIPLKIYDELEKIIMEDFDLYLNGIDCGMIDIWECSEYDEFMQANGYDNDTPMCREEYVNGLSGAFYKKIREILNDYLIQ